MACHGCTSAETEQIWEREKALSAMENTRQLNELLWLSKGVTRAPTDNIWELKSNIATFMALIWVLFGSAELEMSPTCPQNVILTPCVALNF
jgi:hypothetical protein